MRFLRFWTDASELEWYTRRLGRPNLECFGRFWTDASELKWYARRLGRPEFWYVWAVLGISCVVWGGLERFGSVLEGFGQILEDFGRFLGNLERGAP